MYVPDMGMCFAHLCTVNKENYLAMKNKIESLNPSNIEKRSLYNRVQIIQILNTETDKKTNIHLNLYHLHIFVST